MLLCQTHCHDSSLCLSQLCACWVKAGVTGVIAMRQVWSCDERVNYFHRWMPWPNIWVCLFQVIDNKSGKVWSSNSHSFAACAIFSVLQLCCLSNRSLQTILRMPAIWAIGLDKASNNFLDLQTWWHTIRICQAQNVRYACNSNFISHNQQNVLQHVWVEATAISIAFQEHSRSCYCLVLELFARPAKTHFTLPEMDRDKTELLAYPVFDIWPVWCWSACNRCTSACSLLKELQILQGLTLQDGYSRDGSLAFQYLSLPNLNCIVKKSYIASLWPTVLLAIFHNLKFGKHWFWWLMQVVEIDVRTIIKISIWPVIWFAWPVLGKLYRHYSPNMYPKSPCPTQFNFVRKPFASPVSSVHSCSVICAQAWQAIDSFGFFSITKSVVMPGVVRNLQSESTFIQL